VRGVHNKKIKIEQKINENINNLFYNFC
jgi:hypothetical protein